MRRRRWRYLLWGTGGTVSAVTWFLYLRHLDFFLQLTGDDRDWIWIGTVAAFALGGLVGISIFNIFRKEP